MRKLFYISLTLMLLVGMSLAQATGTTQLQVNVAPEAYLSITNATTLLTTAVTDFSTPYHGNTAFSYKIRTTQAGGSGTLQVAFAADFNAGGPSIAGGNLNMTCNNSGAAGTKCAANTVNTLAAVSILTFGADNHSADAGDTGSIDWYLADLPSYKTGAYAADATFTLSAL